MGSQMTDEHGFLKKWKSKGTGYGKPAPSSSSSPRRTMGERPDPTRTLLQPFKPLTFTSKEPQTKPVEFADQSRCRANSKSNAPKTEYTSEDQEIRPSKLKYKNASSDDDEYQALNDISATNWKSRRAEEPKAVAKLKAEPPKKSSRRIDFSASPEPRDRPKAFRSQARGIEAQSFGKRQFKKLSISPSPEPERQKKASSRSAETAEQDHPRRVFRKFNLSPSPEREVRTEKPRAPFKRFELTASPEPEPEKKREFFKPVKEEESEDDEETRKSFKRAAILRDIGGSPNKIKRTLIDAGLGEGLEGIENDDIWRSPPKKITKANQGLSSLAARIANRSVKEEDIDDTQDLLDADATSCPMCHEAVPHTLLMNFSNNRPRSLNTRQQAAFCVHHKRDSALTTYTNMGYPNVSWESLSNRLTPHFTYISSLITSPATTPSHYRPLFASDITYGRNRTLKQSIMGATGLGSTTARLLIPGYYGPRGARAMQEAILLKFNRELRKAAVEDHVVSARAVGGYVASVLVPELGTRLIMEDMKIGEEEARGVMEKSAALGSLVNEELKDVRPEAEKGTEEGGDYD